MTTQRQQFHEGVRDKTARMISDELSGSVRQFFDPHMLETLRRLIEVSVKMGYDTAIYTESQCKLSTAAVSGVVGHTTLPAEEREAAAVVPTP